MHLLLTVTLLLSCVSAIVLPPLITPVPRIIKREAAENICGYYSLAPDGLSMFLGAFFVQSRG